MEEKDAVLALGGPSTGETRMFEAFIVWLIARHPISRPVADDERDGVVADSSSAI